MSAPESIDDLPPLSPDVRAYVDAFAADERPAPEAGVTTWSAIESEIGTGRRLLVPLLIGGVLAVAAAVLLAFGLRGAAFLQDPAPASMQTPWEGGAHESEGLPDYRRAPPRAAGAPASVVEPAPERAVDVTADDGEIEPGQDAEVGEGDVVAGEPESEVAPSPRQRAQDRRGAKSPATGARGSQPPAPDSDTPSSLAAELALFRRAKRALDDGTPGQALKLLREHGEQFPRGALRREGQVLRAEALCAVGRVDDAHALRHRFVASHPGSPLVDRMRAVCR
ncbi:MAG: hypothetical protein K0V04_10865 [Deltaproteobacteria bacterium]|nr:hypothetical protein [Deltaproteobacteria bacterium]